MGSARHSDENMDDDDDKDDTKRKSRNLSEKKRRDQFNMLVNELGKMVTTNTRKMDKSTVLKSTILFLKNHNEIAVKSRIHEIQEDWKPSFLSNEEFTHLILEALDGFIMVFSSNGRIYYASESVTSLLGYLPSELANATIYEITYQDDQSHLYNVLLNTGNNRDQRDMNEENKVSFTCHMKRGGLDFREEITYELVQFNGYFRSDAEIDNFIPNNRIGNNVTNDTKLVFVGTGRLQTPQLIRDMSFVESSKSEFTSRHSLEWKFLFLDHRAPPIIGYLPFEVLGTSGYDYYHVDDLEEVVTCHESLMLKGEGTSCHYRFLTKGQQWIWLQTRFYIEYSQWTSKPEFIVCTHTVVSYTDVMKHRKNGVTDRNSRTSQSPDINQMSSRLQLPAALCQVRSSAWSPKSSKSPRPALSRGHYHGGESDTNSVSPGSQSSRQSVSTTHSSKPKAAATNPTKSVHQPETSAKLPTQPEVDQSCANFVEPQRFVAEPLASVVPTFIAPATPTVPISLTNSTVLLNQQNIVMTTAQNQIQAELQRKHEELQQLIVHQQEELRRVSEQLLIARYGILSPLINVGIPYNGNACRQVASCCTTPNGAVTNPTATNDSIPGINDLQVSIALPVPIMSMEPFPHAATVITVDEDAVPIMHQQQHHHHHSHQQPQQQQQQQQQQQPQQQQQQHQQHQYRRQQQQRHHHHQHHHQQQHHELQRHVQHQHPQHQLQMSNQESHATQMMSYQMCPSNDMIYGSVDTVASVQQRENRN